MPSEQAAGRPMYGSDLYSLGVTTIYLLTGKQPYELETDVQTGEIVWHNFAPSISPMLRQILDKAIRYHPRERYSSPSEMLYDLQSTAQTIPSLPEAVHKTVQIPVNQTPTPPTINGNRKGIIGSLIAAGIIGASVLTFAITKFPSQQVSDNEKPVTPNSSVEATNNQNNQKEQQSPVIPKPSLEEILPDTSNKPISNLSNSNLPNSSYFLIDSAYAKLPTANKQVDKLKAAGYQQAGVFWIPDYPNLSGKELYAVYGEKFSKRTECVDLLRSFGIQNKDAYCTFASKDASAPGDRFYFKQFSVGATPSPTTTTSPTATVQSDYAWLSQREVSNTDFSW